MADLLPILSKEEEEEVVDSPDTTRFRELPPPYSENDPIDVHTSKQVFGQHFAVTYDTWNIIVDFSIPGDWKCGKYRRFA